MNDHETLHGLFVDVAAKRLAGSVDTGSHVEKAKVAQKSVALDKAMQAKRTEKMLTNLKRSGSAGDGEEGSRFDP